MCRLGKHSEERAWPAIAVALNTQREGRGRPIWLVSRRLRECGSCSSQRSAACGCPQQCAGGAASPTDDRFRSSSGARCATFVFGLVLSADPLSVEPCEGRPIEEDASAHLVGPLGLAVHEGVRSRCAGIRFELRPPSAVCGPALHRHRPASGDERAASRRGRRGSAP